MIIESKMMQMRCVVSYGSIISIYLFNILIPDELVKINPMTIKRALEDYRSFFPERNLMVDDLIMRGSTFLDLDEEHEKIQGEVLPFKPL